MTMMRMYKLGDLCVRYRYVKRACPRGTTVNNIRGLNGVETEVSDPDIHR